MDYKEALNKVIETPPQAWGRRDAFLMHAREAVGGA